MIEIAVKKIELCKKKVFRMILSIIGAPVITFLVIKKLDFYEIQIRNN